MKMRQLTVFTFLLLLLVSCKDNTIDTPEQDQNQNRETSEAFNNYWFDGQAEITSYSLEQERYGEMREGTAVLIFVTEDFLPDAQVKANEPAETNINILKLNKTKNFITGIYPYSIMTSVFYPIEDTKQALKVSTSIQEWCGHAYIQINNRENFEIRSHSYFEGEADQNFSLEKNYLEDEVWTQLRINPEALPKGEINMIPSLEYSRLQHKDLKAYMTEASLDLKEDLYVYTIHYPELDRRLIISFEPTFPFQILKWEEHRGQYTTIATRRSQIKSDYWSKNKNADMHLRDSLQLN
jgi:hypothetical protein